MLLYTDLLFLKFYYNIIIIFHFYMIEFNLFYFMVYKLIIKNKYLITIMLDNYLLFIIVI